MRKVFLDIGANNGDTVDQFLNDQLFNVYDPKEYEIFAVEINKKHKLPEKYKDASNVTVIEKAAWIKDGTMTFKCTEGDGHRDQGSSLLPDKKDVAYKYDKTDEVECFDFVKWIVDNFKKDDYILLKIDIEGAEFELLKKMMEEEIFDYFNGICCEFHDVPRAFDKPVRHEMYLQKKEVFKYIEEKGLHCLSSWF